MLGRKQIAYMSSIFVVAILCLISPLPVFGLSVYNGLAGSHSAIFERSLAPLALKRQATSPPKNIKANTNQTTIEPNSTNVDPNFAFPFNNHLIEKQKQAMKSASPDQSFKRSLTCIFILATVALSRFVEVI
ncbi:hypothetical protein O181_011081 [Austropuccinia psidii MF-1]|uniref:Uncharacterized protein n=1 Tax=Austropuccinia psidii MF-1 TaxID=1389203 RepID=A0A9Q3BV39_9BASI|nr:hypothetical protein [Austropuccinia psidii MF-1]